MSLGDFLRDKSKVIHLGRPHPISEDQKQKLHAFSHAQSAVRYTSLHAALSAALPVTRTACVVTTVAALYQLLADPIRAGTFSVSLLLAGLPIALFIHGPLLVIWSSRFQWGVSATEQLFRKVPLGTWLVEQKYEMFCSKLVALADKELGGPISTAIPISRDAQPKHIVRACKKLKWTPWTL